MAVRLQFRRGTTTQWASANPILAPGEPGLELDTRRVKYGDGARNWVDLEYASSGLGDGGGTGGDTAGVGLDGGTPTSNYGGTVPVSGGGVV